MAAASNADRTNHAEELDELIEGWTKQHTSDEVFDVLEGADVPAGPIYSVTDIVEDPQYQTRQMFLVSEIDGIGPVKMPGLAPKLSETPGGIEWYGGHLGAHNEEVFGGLLGLSAAEVAALRQEGVC